MEKFSDFFNRNEPMEWPLIGGKFTLLNNQEILMIRLEFSPLIKNNKNQNQNKWE